MKNGHGNGKNQLRLIGGQMGSRVIRFPEALGLRPTGSRIRETVFNWLGQTLHDQYCLDLFAGSGALGFEAASRGAARVVMCESNRAVVKALEENRQQLAATACQIVHTDCLEWLASTQDRIDIAFCDPPFDAKLHGPVLAALRPTLHPGSRVYVEAPTAIDSMPGVGGAYQVLKTARAGAVHFALLSPAPSSSIRSQTEE